MKKKYKIFELHGFAYETAIKNVFYIINNTLNVNYNFKEHYKQGERLAFALELVFDENGNIIYK